MFFPASRIIKIKHGTWKKKVARKKKTKEHLHWTFCVADAAAWRASLTAQKSHFSPPGITKPCHFSRNFGDINNLRPPPSPSPPTHPHRPHTLTAPTPLPPSVLDFDGGVRHRCHGDLKGKQEVLTQAFPGDQYANLRNAKIEADA